MVQAAITQCKTRTTCQPRFRQSDKNSKSPKARRKVLKTKNETTENKKSNELVVEDSKGGEGNVLKVTEGKEDAMELTKTPKKLGQDIREKKMEEFLAKKKKADEEREKFVKEMTQKKAAEHAEVIREARRLILYRKPLCRRINRALLVSECFKERDAQIQLQKTIKGMEKDEEEEIANAIKEDVMRYEEERRNKEEAKRNKIKTYSIELKKQIHDNETDAKGKEKEEFELEKQDQLNMNKYYQMAKEHEAEEILRKKKKLQQFFKDAIEEKKQFELKLKRDEEFEDRALDVYRNAKERIRKMQKEATLKERMKFQEREKIIVERTRAVIRSRDAEEAEILRRAVEEQEAAEKEKQKARKEREHAVRASIHQFQAKYVAAKAKRDCEEKDLRTWQMMQRFRKDEYDKQLELEEKIRALKKKMEFANILKTEIEIKEVEKQEEQAIEAKVDALEKEMIDKENKKILDYANEVLEESKGVRPLYPINKAIEECKRDMGLLPIKRLDEAPAPRKPKRRNRCPRICNKTVPEDKIHYL